MALQKRRQFMSSYITSQFNYYPLVWIIHNRKVSKKINEVHERALRIVYGEHKTLWIQINLSLYIKETCNIYLLKSVKLIRLSRQHYWMKFFENPAYELRSGVHLPSRNSRKVFFSTESIMNLGVKLWNMVPQNIKSSESLNVFKSKIKYCAPNHYPWRICKTYVSQVGFIN